MYNLQTIETPEKGKKQLRVRTKLSAYAKMLKTFNQSSKISN